MRTDLKALLIEYGCPSPDIIHEGIISECSLSFLQIRDRLYRMGKILFEDTERQIYVAIIRSGFGNMNHAIVAMQLRSNKLMVAGYAKEGLIKSPTRFGSSYLQNVIGLASPKAVVEECLDRSVAFLPDMKRAATNKVNTIILSSHFLTFLFDRYMR